MKLAVISHKRCWFSPDSPSGFATDGGFAFQMRALSELFDATTLVVPCDRRERRDGEIPIDGRRMHIVPLTPLAGDDLSRKMRIPAWLAINARTLVREVAHADAVHAAIPGDISTFGMLLAMAGRKPLYVRHCGNWLVQETVAEHFWKWLMQASAGGRNVMLATGGAASPPSAHNAANRWIFSTSLTDDELAACARPRRAPRSGTGRLIIACRQDALKGTGIVIESLPILRQRIPRISLDVVGDGPNLSEFKALARRLGVSDRVTCHGKVNHHEVIRLMQGADIFAYPTRASEGFPKVVLEALACGLPVVTTRVSVLPQLLRIGCGRLIDEAAPAALASGVEACLSDAAAYERMSRRAHETARQYSLERWRDTIGQWLEAAWGPLQSRA
jgi:hypothetical protein